MVSLRLCVSNDWKCITSLFLGKKYEVLCCQHAAALQSTICQLRWAVCLPLRSVLAGSLMLACSAANSELLNGPGSHCACSAFLIWQWVVIIDITQVSPKVVENQVGTVNQTKLQCLLIHYTIVHSVNNQYSLTSFFGKSSQLSFSLSTSLKWISFGFNSQTRNSLSHWTLPYLKRNSIAVYSSQKLKI